MKSIRRISAFLVFSGSAIVFITLATGCGMQPHIIGITPADKAAQSPATAHSAPTQSSVDMSSAANQNPDYSCPDKVNVTPSYDGDIERTHDYSVCRHRTDESKIMVDLTPFIARKICVFPIEVVDAEHILTKANTQTGGLFYQCSDLAPAGAFVGFQGLQYNSVFIVDYADRKMMEQCLMAGNEYLCPSYSFGQFR
ncbi:hypothetical protein WDW86_19270 [Bdellovibrionota bacterium FG-2]